MRLHLPKTLLAAVLAACAALPTWGEDSGGAVDTPTTTYTVAVGDTTKTFSNLLIESTLPTTTTEAFWVCNSTGEKVTVTSSNQGLLNNAGTIILGNGSYTTTTTGEDGNPSTSASQEVTASQLFLQGWNGSGGSTDKINITSALIVGVNGGDLSQGGAKNAALRFGTDTGASYEVKISGDITVAANATFVAGGNNAVISGSITGDGKTLTLSDFNSAATYNLTGADGESISLGGLTISGDTAVSMNYETATIGTLTLNSTATNAFTLSGGTTTVSTVAGSGSILLNGGTLAVSDTGDFSISGVKFAGGVLDVSSVTGTLTVGGTWTGDSVEKSVKVINANNATIAGSLATSLNTSRLLNYMYKAGNADAGESASSVYRVRREFITATATVDSTQENRIVIESVTGADGSTEFSNVGLSDLLAGDTVTINGLTGWIGDNSSNSISANLVFEGENHINYGSSTNSWITYSGAITGDGTLSYEWSGATYTYNFNGDLSGFTGTISDTTTLNVTIGGAPATEAAKEVNATIDIAGALTVNREASFTEGITVGGKLIINADTSIAAGTVSGNMDLKSGALTINGNVTLNGSLDMKGGQTTGGACLGHVVISETGKLKVSKDMWGLAASAKILLKEGGSLEWNGLTFTGQAEKADVDTGLTFGSDAKLSLTDAHFATNTSIAFSETGEKTLSWTLAGCSIEVQNGTLNVNGTNTNTSLSVSSGSVVFTSSTSLTDSTVSGGNLQFNGSQTTLNGTLTISGGVAENTATGDNTEIRLGTAGKVSIESGSLINDGFTYSNNGANASITGNGQSTLKVYEGNVVLKDVVMEKTVSGDKGIGIAMDNVSLIVNAGTTTLRKDGEGKTQSLSSVSVGNGATLKVENAKVSFGSASVSGKLVVEKETKITGAATISGTAEVKGTLSTGAGSTITTLTGSGVLKSTAGAATVSDASGFTGTLESTGGALTATNVSSTNKLAAVKATGGQIFLIASKVSVSVAELTIGTSSQAQAYTSESALGTVTADKVNIGESNAKFQGNLNITGGLTVQVGSNGQTGGLNMAAAFGGAATGTLTLGSATGTGIELNLSYIPVMTTNDTLTLFTGVDRVLYYEIISAGTGETEAAAVTLSDPAPKTLTEEAVDASNVFNNVDLGYFTVKFVGNNVILTASTNVPEPTTATLSLLALMGLAARRRRRKA